MGHQKLIRSKTIQAIYNLNTRIDENLEAFSRRPGRQCSAVEIEIQVILLDTLKYTLLEV